MFLENTIGIVFLIAFCVLVAKVDRVVFGTRWSPTTLLAVPFTIVVVVYLLIGEWLGFARLDSSVVGVWIAGVVLFWFVGHLFRFLCLGQKEPGEVTGKAAIEPDDGSRAIMWSRVGGAIAVGLLLYAYIVVVQLGGITALASSEFIELWGYGWPGHVRTAMIGILIVVVGSTKRWPASIVINVALMFLVVLLYQSKGAILAPLIAGALYRIISGRYEPKAFHFVVAIAGTFVLFQLVYLIGWAVLDPSSLLALEVYSFFSLHYVSYLFSGILGFSESLHHSATWIDTDWGTLLAPFWNLFAVGFDRQLVLVAEVVQSHYVQISEYGAGSTVHTFFGTIYLGIGPYFGALLASILSIACHAMLIGAYRTQNRWLLVAYCYWGGLLTFGCFEYYFWLLSSIEVPILCLMMAGIEGLVLPRPTTNRSQDPV